MLTAAGHCCGGKPAQGCTIDIQPDTTLHHRHIIFLQTSGRTMVAGIGTFLTSVNANPVFLM
jgi:hypothetical protein